MKQLVEGLRNLTQRVTKDQRGVTGLETAIVLIAFVVVSSVFAYSVLNTGLSSADMGKESIQSGLVQTRSTLESRGGVIAQGDPDNGAVSAVKFVLANAAGGAPVNLSSDKTIISYRDKDQQVTLTPDQWTATWLVGDGDVINPGEMVEIAVQLDALNLTNPLGPDKDFTIEVRPPSGAVIKVNRIIPPEITAVMDLN